MLQTMTESGQGKFGAMVEPMAANMVARLGHYMKHAKYQPRTSAYPLAVGHGLEP